MSNDADCLFCKVAAGEVHADVVHQTATTVAFRDIAPQAPTHVLVIPRHHHRNAVALGAAEPDVLIDLFAAAGRVAEQEGLDNGYRLVLNTGPDANQTVDHAHLHVIGGRSMGWPPG